MSIFISCQVLFQEHPLGGGKEFSVLFVLIWARALTQNIKKTKEIPALYSTDVWEYRKVISSPSMKQYPYFHHTNIMSFHFDVTTFSLISTPCYFKLVQQILLQLQINDEFLHKIAIIDVISSEGKGQSSHKFRNYHWQDVWNVWVIFCHTSLKSCRAWHQF